MFLNKQSCKTTLRILLSAVAPAMTFGLEVNVERIDVETGLPWGYADATGLRAATETYSSEAFDLDVSAAPFVDYMVAMNSGAPGILAEKATGAFLSAEQNTVAALTGGANGNFAEEGESGTGNPLIPVGTERFSLILKWSDGTPLPAANGWWGVSWGGWSATETQELEVRVDLASEEQVNVVHWFNDGWLYATDVDGTEGTVHTVLQGHEFTVTHHGADGSIISTEALVLPSGGAGQALGKTGDPLIRVQDHRQFYTATVSATRSSPGDYLVLHHRAANIGYRATAVTLGNDRPWSEGGVEPTTWLGYPVDAAGWVNTEGWLGYLNIAYDPWIWVDLLGTFGYIPNESGWVLIPRN